MKKLRLHKRTLSNDDIAAMAQDTLTNGGFVAAEIQPKDPGIGDNAVPRIGAVMLDGTILAGISPETGKAMYAVRVDARLTMTFNEAAYFAKTLNREKYLGHDDWRVPTKEELKVLFNNRAAIGGFNVSGSNPVGWYWSATPHYNWGAWCQRFSDGLQYNYDKGHRLCARYVR